MWRAKWRTSADQPHTHHLVTSSMQGGSRVYRLASTPDNDSFCVTGSVVQTDERNPAHLAYGIDVIGYDHDAERGEGHEYKFTLASCSFYDNLVQVWSAET